MSVCPNCRQPMIPGDIYCGSCGASLQAGTPAPPPISPPPGVGGIQCPACGFMNEPDAIFCERDGTPLKAAPPQPTVPYQPPVYPPPPPPPPVPAGPIEAIVLPDNTEIIVTKPRRTFGRMDFVRCVPQDKINEISRGQFTIISDSGGLYIEDGSPDPANPQAWKQSANGTSLNSVPLQARVRQLLKPNDRINVAGLFDVVFRTR